MTDIPGRLKIGSRLCLRRVGTGLAGMTTSATGRFVLFGAIGLSGFIPNLATLALLTGIGHVNYVVATVAATQLAIVWNFLLLENLAYATVRSGSVVRRVAEFFALNNLDLILRIPLLAVLVELVHLGCLVATALSLAAMFAIRFLATDRLIYRLRNRPGGSVSLGLPVPAPDLSPLVTEDGRVAP